MRRSCLLALCLLACLIVSVLPVEAQLPQISSGLNYLTTVQSQDGTWQSETVESTTATLSVLDTLKLLNQTAGTPYISGTAWLQAQTPVSVNYIAERLRAIGLVDVSALLSSVDSINGGWGGDAGFETNPLDTASALKALKSANYSDQTVIFGAISCLFSTQNLDGGWGFAQDADSNVFVTAQVTSALAQYKNAFQMSTQLASAAAFLLSKQNPDNGFGSDTSTVFETALAFIALIESGQGQALSLQNAVNYLTTTQAANGSWNDDPYSTALALRALAYIKPDLTITAPNIVVSPATPTVGSNLTITATVNNIGLEAAANVTVRLLDNGVTIGDQLIAAIASGGTGQAVFAISPLTPVGEHKLTITVDPLNTITEVSKANNSATLRIWGKALPDLVALPENLTIIPAYPKTGENVILSANIANMGESDAGAFSADLYDGDPNNGGTKLGSFSNPGIPGGQWGSGSVTFSLAATGSHTLYLVVDPLHAVTELSTSNNTAQKIVTVNATGGTGFIDLTIPMNGLTLAPARPHSGDSVTVTLLAENLGTEAATADLELFDGNPATGGTLLHKSTITLNAGETRTVAVPWQIPTGIHTLYATIDRSNIIIERDKTNNSQTYSVMTDMVDIEISASDISIIPEHPMAGDPATVKMIIQNRGIATTGAFNVNLYNGDPATGGTLLQTFAVTDLSGDTTQELNYPFTAARGTYRFYVVCDPENRVVELHKDNNLAIRSLLVKTSAEAKGADLVPLEFDVLGVSTDPQSLRISGTTTVKFQNKGDDKVTTPFRITVFEDKDGDGIYTEGTDVSLGYWDYATPMNPNMVGTVTINVSGTVTFRDAPIYAMLDSGQVVFEQNKGNNSIRRGSACENRPTNPIEPVVKWRWKGQGISNPPVVKSLTDTNGDGLIDDKDLPAIIFTEYTSLVNPSPAKLWALRGDNGATVFSFLDQYNHPIDINPYIAAGDIDGDGKPEIVVNRSQFGGYQGILAFNYDGTLKWDDQQAVKNYNNYTTISVNSMLSLADVNSDGKPAIVMGPTVINADGSIRWVGKDVNVNSLITSGVGAYEGTGYSSVVVDLDLDGKNEIVAGNTAYNADGTTKWWNKSLSDGAIAIANFDDDPYPEIVLFTPNSTHSGVNVYLLDHNGNVKWGPVYNNSLDPSGQYSAPAGIPVIADFDGDGELEIGVGGFNKYFILDKNGNLKNTFEKPYIEDGYGATPTVFDLNGDGHPKVIFKSTYNFKIFDGKTGVLLFKERFWGWTKPSAIVADLNGDGHAEIVVVGNDIQSYGGNGDNIRVYGSKNNDWVSTRKIWNQPSYHVTNVNDDGSIPQYETPSWLTNNNYRCQVPTSNGPSPYLAADLSASFVRADMSGFPASVVVTARIGNGGARPVDAGVKVSISAGDPANGGSQIGTITTTKALNPGDYEDLSITWSTPPEGSYKLLVVVDPDGAVSECNKTNNSVELQVTVAGGRPDLSISAEDMQAPASIPAGSLAAIVVTVRNSGSAPSAPTLLRLYAGNPATGGKQVGADFGIPAVAAGGAFTIRQLWNTSGAQGTTWIYASIDPDAAVADMNRGNNSAMKALTVIPAEKPDLQISGEYLSVSAQSVAEGTPITVTASIYNRGLPVGAIKAALYDGSPAAGGRLVATALIPQILATGESARVTFVMETVGVSGVHQLMVVADPDNRIAESDENNNQAGITVQIAPAGLGVDLQADKPTYNANQAVQFTLTVVNTRQTPRTVGYDLLILDSNGVQTAIVRQAGQLQLGGEAAASATIPWNSETVLSGTYQAVITLKEDGKAVARAAAGFAIQPSKVAGISVAADKATYRSSEQVSATITLTGTSPNYVFSNLIVKTTVSGSAGQPLFSESKTVVSLVNGQRVELKSYWNTARNPGGSYTLRAELMEGATSIAVAATNVTIESSSDSGDGLKGSVTPAAAKLEAGQEQQITCVVENRGNAAISGGMLQLLLVDPDSGVALKPLELPGGALALEINANRTSTVRFATTGLPTKPLLAILRAETASGVKSLGSAVFQIVDTTLPTLTVSALSNGSITRNETLNLAGTATDNSGIKELSINGTVVPVAQDGSFSHALLLKAGDNLIQTVVTDLGGNQTTDSRTIRLDQTAPELAITSPADNSKTALADLLLTGTINETATVSIKLADAEQPVSLNDTGFSAQLILKPGINTIIITAIDLAGNSSSLKRTVIYDDQKPSLAVTVPAQDIRTNKADLTIVGTVSDPYTAVTVSITVDGITYTPAVVDGQFEQPLTFSEEKNYAIIVTASNEAGTSTVVQRNVIYDITPPGFAINPVVSPTKTSEQLISGTREAGSTVSVTCSTAVVGTVEYPDSTTWRIMLTNLTVGDNPITAVATDETGNSSTLTTQITYTLPSQEPLFGYAIFGNSGINIAGAILTDSYRSGICSGHNKGSIGTNSTQRCAIRLTGAAIIRGKALVGSGGNPSQGICLTGLTAVTAGLGTLESPKPLQPVSDPGGGQNMGSLNLSGNKSKTLTEGTYRFSSISLSGSSKLTVSGKTTLIIDGTLAITGTSSIEIPADASLTVYLNSQSINLSGAALLNRSSTPKKLVIYGTLGLKSITLSGSTNLHGLIYAPSTDITISGALQLYGSVIGNNVSLSGSSGVHFDETLLEN